MSEPKESYCEHVKAGARITQRLELPTGVTVHNCWQCAETANNILGEFERLTERLRKVVDNPK